jgi:hypothetical protein
MKPSLRVALLCYAALALLAGLTLEGVWRLGVWVFLAGLAVKSWLATARGRES